MKMFYDVYMENLENLIFTWRLFWSTPNQQEILKIQNPTVELFFH